MTALQTSQSYTVTDTAIFDLLLKNEIYIKNMSSALAERGVAQRTSNPPQKLEDKGSNPARV
jgi:hypothetical protein